MQLIHMDDEVEKESEDYDEEEGVGDTSLLADMRFRQASGHPDSNNYFACSTFTVFLPRIRIRNYLYGSGSCQQLSKKKKNKKIYFLSFVTS
jgi:hypothetical protein